MKDYLIKHSIGIFFTLLLVFSTNMQGLAGYMDYQMSMEQKTEHDSDKNESKALFSQTSTEEENQTSSKEITEKIQYFHQINLFAFFDAGKEATSAYFVSENYISANNGVTTQPPELI